MNPNELAKEWEYIYAERLGMLIQVYRPPTNEEIKIAKEEADAWINRLKQAEGKK